MDGYINRNDLPDMVPRMKRALDKSSSLLAQETKGNISDMAPVDHGNLQTRWDVKKQGDDLYLISTNVEYALVQNEGADPFEIFPRVAQSLRFEIGGEVIFAKSVSHPGFAGTHYIDAGISQAEGRRQEFVEIGLSQEGLT